MQRLSTVLIATFTALTISLPLKAETDPCTRAYSVAATIMLARQMGTLIPEVIKNTNALIAALPEKQAGVIEPVLRNVIIDAYKREVVIFGGPSIAAEFGNSYALKCLEGKEDSFSKIIWDESTRKAFGMWANVMSNDAETAKSERSEKKALTEAFEKAEAEARALENQYQKVQETELSVLNALAEQKVVGRTLDDMTTRITTAWRRPVGFKGGLEVYIRISLKTDGEIEDLRVVRTSGDVLFDRSAITAVKRAAPFDEVKQFDAATFEEKFRSLTVKFRPED
jgi:TonB family protein